VAQTVTVSGSGFASGLTVELTTASGSQSPTPSNVTSTSLQIKAVFAAGNCVIVIKNPDGQSSASFSFTAKGISGLSFAPRVDLPTGGSNPISMALEDFNGDGKLDIAFSNEGSNTITVLLNNGDGTFKSPVTTTVDPGDGLNIGEMVEGDFNEDGKPDLVVGIIAGGQTDVVLLGNGDGTFKQVAAIPNSFGFFQARAVDLNGDKHLDIVAGGNGNMSVALGKGDGTFSPSVMLPYGPLFNSYEGIDVGDVTGTGKLDIVGADWEPYTGDLVYFKGVGDGTFNPPTWQTPPRTSADGVALADFDGDGKLDVLVGYTGGSAAIALGNGDGTFKTDLGSEILVYSGNYQSGNGVYVNTADLDLDGKPDAIAVDYLAGTVYVLLNDAQNMSAGTKYTYTIGPGLARAAAGDLNGDGIPDLVVLNNRTAQVSLFLSKAP
jgi:hypothetical protein